MGTIKPSYFLLEEPSLASMRMPSIEVLQNRNSVTVVRQLQSGIFDTAKTWKLDEASVQSMEALCSGLLSLLGNGDPSNDQKMGNLIHAFAMLGFAAGVVETESGVALSGKTECHLSTALVAVGLEVKDGFPGQELLASYLIESGYFLQRTGGASVPRLLEIATLDQNLLKKHSP